MAYIPRLLEPRIFELLKADVSQTGCLLIEGARQVGKTTLARQALENWPGPSFSIDLEDARPLRSRIDACEDFADFTQLLADELGFKPTDDSLLVIDEAQESQTLGRFVRYMKERWQGPRVILTGSSLTRLFHGDIRYPVGRVTRLHVAPLSFPEFLRAIDRSDWAEILIAGALEGISENRHRLLLEAYDRFLSTGGMPSIVRAHAEGHDHRPLRDQILADLDQDFLRLFGEDDIDTVRRCLRSVANFVGSPSKLTTVMGSKGRRARRTAEEVFARLEQWSVVLHAPQGGPSPESAHNFLPKRYLFDTGLLRHLRESSIPAINILDTIDAAQRKPLGGILENQVAIAIHHQTGRLQGWKRSSAGSEIDFVVQKNGGSLPVECKAALQIKKTHLKGLAGYLDSYGLDRGVVVGFAPYAVQKWEGRTIEIIPAYAVSSWLAAS